MSNNPGHRTARVRVYLPTYRRHRLLQRALASLRAQTFADWVCELHNDDPADREPGRILEKLNDPRFMLRHHEQNLGGTQTFNLFFQGTEEPFSSILEDDNWWEPEFLRKMIATAGEHPDVTVFWANQKLWQEQADGSFQDTGRFVRGYSSGDQPQLIPWGQRAQIYGAVHSIGAALFRSAPNQTFTTPAIPQASIEIFRERMFPYPLVFVPEPLAHFSITVKTSRSDSRSEWALLQAMFAASFLKHSHYTEGELKDLWSAARANRPPSTNTLLYASLIEPACRSLRNFARLSDWLLFLRGVLRRPQAFWRVLRCRHRHRDWWDFLDKHTAERFSEALEKVDGTPVGCQGR